MQKKKQKEKREELLTSLYGKLLNASDAKEFKLLKEISKLQNTQTTEWVIKKIKTLLDSEKSSANEKELLCAFKMLRAGANRNNERKITNLLLSDSKKISQRQGWEMLFILLLVTIRNVGTFLSLRKILIFMQGFTNHIPDKGVQRLCVLQHIRSTVGFIYSYLNNLPLQKHQRKSLDFLWTKLS